jgi:hypothetical protein
LGYPHVNFTPCLGSAPAALCDLALQKETCHMGHDGKTGETLLKSRLAPMFAARNLEVMSFKLSGFRRWRQVNGYRLAAFNPLFSVRCSRPSEQP